MNDETLEIAYKIISLELISNGILEVAHQTIINNLSKTKASERSNRCNLLIDSLEKLTEKKENENGYLEYLKYCNRRILTFTDSILLHSSNPPVMILVSDHGYRRHNEPTDSMTCFNNLVAIHLPSSDFKGIYESMSNVNLGRWLLNNLFNQQLPLLKDSSVYLWRNN
jgi:hypothetical protein